MSIPKLSMQSYFDNHRCYIKISCTQEILKFFSPADGFAYERSAIEEWVRSRRKTSPMTNLPLDNDVLEPLTRLRKEIQEFVLECDKKH